jgi:nitric oxide dioxygenase
MLLSELKTSNTRRIVFAYGNKSKLEHPFADLLKRLAKENSRLETIFFYENVEKGEAKLGLVNLDLVNKQLESEAKNAQYFFCGPSDFMYSIQQGLLKNEVKDKNINFEFFGAKTF